MNKNPSPILNTILKGEKVLGGLKLAVVIILVFTAYLIVGTFVESYHGAEFAQRAVYKSWPFMIVQFFIFLSVFLAALLRMPLKKNLYGFYTVHLGIIILLSGSFITYYAGVDANMNLRPNTATQTLVFSEDVLEMSWVKTDKKVSLPLPASSSKVNIDKTYDQVKISEYLPYAKDVFSWKESKRLLPKNSKTLFHSAKYRIQNKFISEEIILSLHPDSTEYSSSIQLGPLNVHLFPDSFYSCIDKAPQKGYLLWNRDLNKCQSIEKSEIQIHQTKTGKDFFAFKEKGKVFTFIPALTSVALDENLAPIADSPFKVLDLSAFTKGKHLFLFGKTMALKDEDQWQKKPVSSTALTLPWMGFQLQLLDYQTAMVPTLNPSFIKPIQEGSKIVEGDLKALKISYQGQDFWLKNTKHQIVGQGENQIRFDLTKKTKRLPFQLTLNKFHMEKDPGTNQPASYESYVSLFDSKGTDNHKIYMNNPLKYSGFTFYQASYFQISQGVFGSTLSVNYDPGRPVKYFGSLLLVLGAIWHYFIRKRRIKHAAV